MAETATFRAYADWQGLTAETGDLQSSFSNLRLAFSAPVADEGQPGYTSPEELLLGAALSAYCTSFMQLAGQMALDIASLEVSGELVRQFDEVDGHTVTELRLSPHGKLRTGIGFEKVHDMFRRAATLARHRSPVLRALAPTIKVTLDATFGEAK